MVDNSLKTLQNEDPNTSCLPITTLEALNAYMLNPPSWRNAVIPKARRGPPSDAILAGQYNCHVEAENWRTDISNRITGASAPQNLRVDDSKPELLVCHDMRNGYLDDRFINGTQTYDAYRLYNWTMVDIFVYFSHHFVTIPPLGWINAAHKHGVAIMGTIITEWAEGANICATIIESDESMKRVVNSLVHISKYFKLDGWLLNIENNISDSQRFAQFVRKLTEKMHLEIPESRVIWYDSVTIHGKLNWQNELNANNYLYYDSCDGIFLNYTWTEKHLSRSLTACGRSNPHKVFVGVDVFGRNQYGGGGFKTDMALDVINRYGLSTALFATGWTHESMCDVNNDAIRVPAYSLTTGSLRNIASSVLNSCFPIKPNNATVPQSVVPSNSAVGTQTASSRASSLSDETDLRIFGKDVRNLNIFLTREDLFWGLIWKYFKVYQLETLPFSSSFCQGSGLRMWKEGNIELYKPWFNLNLQEVQPNVPCCPLRYNYVGIKNPMNTRLTTAPPALNCKEVYFRDSFNGGSCLKFTKLLTSLNESYVSRVFLTNFSIKDCVYLYVVNKSINGGSCNLLLLVQNQNDDVFKVKLVSDDGSSSDNQLDDFDKCDDVDELLPHQVICDDMSIQAASGDELKMAQRNILRGFSKLYLRPGVKNGWTISLYVLPFAGVLIREIGVQMEGQEGSSSLLGYMSLIPSTIRS